MFRLLRPCPVATLGPLHAMRAPVRILTSALTALQGSHVVLVSRQGCEASGL